MPDPVSSKELARRAIDALPDDATIDDAMERLYVIRKIQRGLADADAGRTIPHEEVKRRVGEMFLRWRA